MDLNAILWTLIVGVPTLAWVSYWTIGILFPMFEWLRPKPKKPRQITLAPFMHDRYPYERQWVTPEDDNEHSEAEGFESSAVTDEEDN